MDNLNHFAVYLRHTADTETKFEIKIGGKPVSFNGKRVFATIGAAKSCLNRHIQSTLNQFEYVTSYPLPEIVDYSVKILKETPCYRFGHTGHSNSLTSDEERKSDCKQLIKELLESGMVTITEA